MDVVCLYIHRCSLAFTDFYMILYHGSEKEIKKPYYRGSRPHTNLGLSKKNERDKRARDAYFAIDKDSYVPGGIYVVNIIDEGIKTLDPRIR